jgi:hypothetical protein
MGRLATASRRNRFVILRTASSPPVALHPASRRRSYLRLRGCDQPRSGLAPLQQRVLTDAPTPPYGDAVAFRYEVTTHFDGDSHPTDKTLSQTHWMAGTSPAMTARYGKFVQKNPYLSAYAPARGRVAGRRFNSFTSSRTRLRLYPPQAAAAAAAHWPARNPAISSAGIGRPNR